MQNYKVFNNNDLIIFGSRNEEPPSNYRWSDFQIIKSENMGDIIAKIKSFQAIGKCIIETLSPDTLFKLFASHFKVLQAAGGLVLNDRSEILMIHRFEHWDFPKGKVEKGENIRDAAIREVEEETGVESVSITKSLPCVYHIYQYSSKWILKETYWYSMYSEFKGVLKPQLEEDILAAIWVPLDFLGEYMAQSYGGLRLLVDESELSQNKLR